MPLFFSGNPHNGGGVMILLDIVVKFACVLVVLFALAILVIGVLDTFTDRGRP